jgi:CheY-like chemotaxis protein
VDKGIRDQECDSEPRVNRATIANAASRGLSIRMASEKVYSLTEAGAKARETLGSTLDQHARRILQIVDGDTHVDVIRGWLRHYSNGQLSNWLGDLEIAGLLTAQPSSTGQDLDFKSAFPAIPRIDDALTDTDALRINAGTLVARTVLKARGAYLAEGRLKNRAPLAKLPTEISVLVVEDDPDQAALAQSRLDVAGYQVRVADSHRAFLNALRDHGAPDAVFLDVMLPDGDGFDILVYVRRHPRLSLLPVIMLTVKGEPADIRKGLALGADGYIPKPYSKSLLADALRQVLKHA